MVKKIMSSNFFRYGFPVKLSLICMVMLSSISSVAQDNNLVVIGNQAGVPADIKMNELKAVFRGERQRWSDGTKVVIAMIKTTTPLGKAISEKIYSMNGDEVRGFWAGISFAGKFDPPNVFNTETEVETFVSQNPGAIAILDRVTITPEVKNVLVSGKKIF
jgi:ABC-type phosphate transport system substrate-binding protein